LLSVEEDLRALEQKLNALKLDYERYFLGTRPREPVMTRQEIQKTVTLWSNTPIQNTALRFKFNSINARYQAMKRQWDSILRQMEAGTYKRDVFKANIRSGPPASTRSPAPAGAEGVPSSQAGHVLIAAYREAAETCGLNAKGLTANRLQDVVDQQTAVIRKKTGCADVHFRVVVQDGRVKLKAAPVASTKDR